jgi:hypothetical protein
MERLSSDALLSLVRTDLDVQCPLRGMHPDSTAREYAAYYLETELLKKYTDNVSEYSADRAQDKFLSANEKCRRWEYKPESLLDELLLGTFAEKMRMFFTVDYGDPLIQTFGQILDDSRFGPGANTGLPSSLADHYSKSYDSVLGFTSETLYVAYTGWCCENTLRLEAELSRILGGGNDPYTLFDFNELFFVTKNNEIDRCACKEPAGNAHGQLGIGEIITTRLKTVFNISLSEQPQYNRELARLGSLYDGFVTVDLVSASDSNALAMTRRFTPKSFHNWLDLYRTPNVKLPDGELVPLHMLSSMGNGFTFPYETALFLCVVSAVYDVLGIPMLRNTGSTERHTAKPGNFGVFGDDIIVVKDAAPMLLRLLRLLGHTVNNRKTSLLGPFRESCGCDYYNGLNVRPVHLTAFEKPQEIYIAVNLLNEWTARTGISLPRSVDYLMGGMKKILYVPMHEAHDAGLKIPLHLMNRKPKARTPKAGTEGIGYRFCRDVPGYKLYHYRCLRPEGMTKRIGEWYVASPPRRGDTVVRLRVANASGVIASYLRGYIRDSKLNVRANIVTYKIRDHLTPSWDAGMNTDCLPKQTNLLSVRSAVERNLLKMWM